MFSFLLDGVEILLELMPRLRRKRDRLKKWTGTVVAKKTRALSKQAYLVIFRTDEGKRRKFRFERKEDFDLYGEGRRYVKKEGDDLPDTKPYR